ncbi:MAG: GNAT family N-acetyltransferase [Abditibacteriota bacterium]|nr:GNAT family N-acetyltransferase [Abditibacteriota bacterium]
MIIRSYRSGDLSRMAQIWNEIVEEGAAFPQEELLDTDGARRFFSEQSHTGVAEEGGDICGLYILHPNNVGRCGHLCNASFAVSSSMRGRHIGEALVKDCLLQARALGFRVLQFNAVVAANLPARRLYEKLGFVQLGIIPGGFRQKDGSYADICPYYKTLQE